MSGVLWAWIEPDETGYVAAFVAAGTTRIPASRSFATVEEARTWVEAEATAFGAVVTWGHSAPSIAGTCSMQAQRPP